MGEHMSWVTSWKQWRRAQSINGFGMKSLATRYYGLFSIVVFGVVDTAAEGFCNDEIHPSEVGFDVLATRFNDTVRAALPARKRHAVTG